MAEEITTDMSEDKEVVRLAVDFVIDKTEDLTSCPFCAKGFIIEDEEHKALKDHLMRTHAARMTAWYFNPALGPDAIAILARARETEAAAPLPEGVEVVEDNTDPGLTHVPQSVMQKLRATGQYGRWVSPQKMQVRYDQGFRTVPRPEEVSPTQLNTADSHLRSNELVYMAQPMALRQKNRSRYQARVAEDLKNLPASIEQKDKPRSDVGKQTYEHLIQRGMPANNAAVIARQAEKRGRPIFIPAEE